MLTKEQHGLLQLIFTIVFCGLRQQGFRRAIGESPEGNITCMYRAPNGDACGIGQALTDEAVAAMGDANTTAISNPDVRVSLATSLAVPLELLEALNSADPALKQGVLRRLQACHDEAEDEDVEENLLAFAKTYDLLVPPASLFISMRGQRPA